MNCTVCGARLNETLGYCQNCVAYELRNFEYELTNLLDKYPDISIIPDGPNLLIRHIHGEEIFF